MNNSSGRAAVFPGTFDPVTNGHLDIIKRASRLFERLLVGVAPREEKGVLFSLEERIAMIRGLTGRLSNVEVMPIHGLLVNFTRRHKVNVVIRGLRAVSDFEFEFQMGLMNRKLRPSLETLFLIPSEPYTYLNSTVVKEISRLGGDVSAFVAPAVARMLDARYRAGRNA